ncbi:MAG: GFA family protein [Halioglobus sp.]|nr:GFA family protein [Halioglobus sp.]
MKITGSCFCGLIEYEAELEGEGIGICHCRDCQIFSGSAFRTSGMVSPQRFRFTRGEPKIFAKVADSGAVRRMAFCGECGTHLCSLPEETEEERGYVSIRVASSHQFHQLKPVAELFCASRVSWLSDQEGAAQFDGMIPRPK